MARAKKPANGAEPPRRGRPPDPEGCARRRAEILEIAAKAFAAKGFAGTEVQEIADAAGIGKGTVYRYLPTKRELFLEALDRKMEELTDAVDAAVAATADPMERIRLGIHAYLGHFDAHPELVELIILERAVFKDRRRPTYFRYRDDRIAPWLKLFRERIAAGEVRRIPPERIIGVIGDALYGTIFTNYFEGRRGSFRDQAEDLLDIVLHGILAGDARRPRSGRALRARRGRRKSSSKGAQR